MNRTDDPTFTQFYRYEKQCNLCGKTFWTNRRSAAFHSPACKQKHYRLMKNNKATMQNINRLAARILDLLADPKVYEYPGTIGEVETTELYIAANRIFEITT